MELHIYTIIFLILGIVEYNLLFGFKLKYLILEIIGALLLYFPIISIFAIIHPFVKSIWKDDIGMQILLDNIPNYLLLYLNIKIILENKKKKI